MKFSGIPADAFAFYDDLEADNSKAFWEANRERWRTSVREPIEALADELADIGQFHVFRPYNDMRYHKNRPIYKIHQGAVTEGEGGTAYYFQVSGQGLLLGYGYHSMQRDQLARFRRAVDDDVLGAEIEALVAAVPRGQTVGAVDELKTAPRGYPKDHPRIEILRRKGLMVSRRVGMPNWVHDRSAIRKIREFWASGAPMSEWLDTHVGPSEEVPDDIF